METFAYSRVSTKDQTTANQKLRSRTPAIGLEGVSGKVSASQRPQFKALLGQIRDGETLVVSKLEPARP